VARTAEGDHQAGDVVDDGREEEQERKDRVGPAVEHEADERQHQVLRAARHRVVQQQRRRQEVEDEQKRAEDHDPQDILSFTASPLPFAATA
jgi:hypothetical protein